MSGLFGIWWREPRVSREQVRRVLSNQSASMCRHPQYLVDASSLDHRCGIGRIHLGILDQGKQPVLSPDDRYALCLDGEFYNQASLRSRFLGHEAGDNSDADLALALYQKVGWSWLRDVNGLFSLALYDRQTQQLQLASDRFGLRPLYYYEGARGVSFGGEVKAVLADPTVGRRLDSQAVTEFFTFGYLLEDRTWIQDVRLLPPATIATIDDNGIRYKGYWSWQEIKPQPDSVSVDEAAEELGRLWIQAVRQRVDRKRVGLTLSGGLDSRAVLAAIPDNVHPVHAVTFGKADCDDHRLAARAAAVKGATHHFVPITENNWLAARFPAVWWTDGHLNLMHMHGMDLIEIVKEYYDVNLHAFAGDLILGGSYLSPAFLNVKPADVVPAIHSKMRLRNLFFGDRALLDYLGTITSAYRNVDVFFLHNRVRRFTINGPLILETSLFDRKPTYDYELIQFCYSLPDEFRYQGKIYKKMLLRYFPEFYAEIPWQKTGLPISSGKVRHRLSSFTKRVQGGIRHRVAAWGIYLSSGRSYTDYNRWTRIESVHSLIEKTLLSHDARWPEYLPVAAGRALVEEHVAGRRLDAEIVLLLLTFETYLRQLEI